MSVEAAGEKKMAAGENFGDSFHPEKEGARGVGGRRSEHGDFHQEREGARGVDGTEGEEASVVAADEILGIQQARVR